MTSTLDTDRRRSSSGVDVARREPIVPAWLRSPNEARALAYYHARHLFYDIRFHGTRLPKYGLRWMLRAPRGVWRVLIAAVQWVSDPDGREEVALVRQTVGQSNRSIPTVVKAREDHHRQMILRLLIIVGALLAGLVIVLRWDPTTSERAYLAVIAVMVLGWIGSFGQKTVADAPTSAEVVPRFTPQVVRAALEAVPDNDLARAIKADPENAIRFLTDPVRAGGGWEILIDLPPGIEAHKITSRRGALASGLRRPLSTVWPTPDPQAHEGRLRLFVADKPLAQAERPPWTAGHAPELSVFDPQPIGIDERGDPVTLTLAYRSAIVAGLPDYGKSFFARQLAATCSLDPTCKLWLWDLKGTGDLNVLAPVAHELRAGDDPDDLDAALKALSWLVDVDFPRRADAIADLTGTLCPENKITRETAADPALDLGPVLIMVDEISTLFESKHRKEFTRLWSHLVRKGRAVGYMAWGFTQKPDAEAIPTSARDNVTVRASFRVGSDTANRAALGPLHKQGWRADAMTADDVGVAIISADTGPTVCRMPVADNVAARQVIARARRSRETTGRLTGLAAGEASAEGVTPDTDQRTVAELVAAVWPVNNGGRPLPACHGAVLADRLAMEWPDRFTGWECADVTGALAGDGIDVRSVKYKGRAARGVRWEHLAPVVEYRTERRTQ